LLNYFTDVAEGLPMNQPVKTGISMIVGFAFGWLTLIVAPVLSWIVMMVAGELFGQSSGIFSLLVLFVLALPLLAVIALGIGFLVKGHKRAAAGVLAAALSAIALTALLVAACFGLFFTGQ
jgi:hypothetical protein